MPLQPDHTLWTERLSMILAGGISIINMVCKGPIETALDLSVIHGYELVLTLAYEDLQPRPSWRRLAPCTLRVSVDTSLSPDKSLKEKIAMLLDFGFSIVIVGYLPPKANQEVWIEWLSARSVAAVNIEELPHASVDTYRQFLYAVSEFSDNCSIPVISDLVLMQRFFPDFVNVGSKCPAGRFALFVSEQAEVRPCRRSRLCLGSLDNKSLSEIWNDERLLTWSRVPDECLKCAIKDCGGGCRARRRRTGRDKLCPGPL